jgi:ATP-dependent helicase HrpB
MMLNDPAPLPIDDVLPAILGALASSNRLVLAAPPGAGKTTRVPLALAGLLGLAGVVTGRILMLEPRRIAARMAAERMASSLGEKLGQTVGLTTRVDRKVSAATRIEVVTDGLFTRRILSDPELKDVGAVLFDEFHERRLNSDLGLALALESQGVLREDLRLLIMSATLDTASVAKAITAPVIESEGRQYPVETKYLGRKPSVRRCGKRRAPSSPSCRARAKSTAPPKLCRGSDRISSLRPCSVPFRPQSRMQRFRRRLRVSARWCSPPILPKAR